MLAVARLLQIAGLGIVGSGLALGILLPVGERYELGFLVVGGTLFTVGWAILKRAGGGGSGGGGAR